MERRSGMGGGASGRPGGVGRDLGQRWGGAMCGGERSFGVVRGLAGNCTGPKVLGLTGTNGRNSPPGGLEHLLQLYLLHPHIFTQEAPNLRC